jgi:pimeloyl-ACP methyl ester carboxylesterase
MNYSPKFFVKLAWGKHSPLTKEKHQKYIEKFKNQDERFGTWGFAQALAKENDDVWKIEDQLNQLSKIPVLLLWGAADKLITLKSYEYWKKMISNKRIEYIYFAFFSIIIILL